MTKQSRKELLKREDAFLLAAETGAHWMEKHRTPGLVLVGALLLVAAGIWGTSTYLHQRDHDASNLFEQAWLILDAGTVKGEESANKAQDANVVAGKSANANDKAMEKPTGPVFDSEKEQWTAARQKFEVVLDKTGYRGVGLMAALLIGDLSEKLGDHARAEVLFGELRKRVPAQDHLAFLATERYAYLRENQGDRDGALEALHELASDDKHFYADYAQVHQARIHMAKNDKDTARSMLEHVEKSFPNSSLMEDVRAQLQELGGSAGDAVIDAPLPQETSKAAP